MKAVVLSAVKTLEVRDHPVPELRPGEALIQIKAAALNHRDVWIWKGEYAGVKYPIIPGSDGAGVVAAVGAPSDQPWIGREVVINPSFDWGTHSAAQGTGFSILGLPKNGTLAESVIVPVTQLATKPAHLSWDQAAALPLAGLTAYRAIFTRASLQSGETILINGIGGGVATFALQFARAAGAKVWVTSSSEEKIRRAQKLGAEGGYLYTTSDWSKIAVKETGGFNVIVDSAGGPGFEQLLEAAAPGGRIVFYGATRGNPPALAFRKIFWRQLSLLGTTMGSPDDWSGLVKFVAHHGITSAVSDRFSLDEASRAFELVERGGQFGKIVVVP